MTTITFDPRVEADLRAQRAAWGAARHDEVWDGFHVLSPMPHVQHHDLVNRLAFVLTSVAASDDLVLPGLNVSDRDVGWEQNYRVPDVAVYLAASAAKIRHTHAVGGPDFAVEIESAGDRLAEKLEFYAKIGTRQLLVVYRDPWAIEMFLGDGRRLLSNGRGKVAGGIELASAVFPLAFRLVGAQPRPKVEVRHVAQLQSWLV